MANTNLLQSRVEQIPIIYAYELIGVPDHAGLIKVGYTVREAEVRIAEQLRTSGVRYRILLKRTAMRKDGTTFDDHAVHRVLRRAGIPNPEREWFRCDVQKVEDAINAVMAGSDTILERTQDFKMRPEQQRAVEKTSNYFTSFYKDPSNSGLVPHFLWNAKMRFGKTFTSYQLALKMGWKRVLILTFKPAVKNAWKEDLLTHKDFEGWQFCEKRENREFNPVNESKPYVCFASFQDVLGKNASGGIKSTNEWIQQVKWDCIVLDEYHYGAWGKNAKSYYDKKDPVYKTMEEREKILAEDASSAKEMEVRELFDEGLMPLQTKAYLYLSGTPFRAISSGEFIEEQIFNWTYSDEQQAKQDWSGGGYNPYAQLPKMVMLTYQLPDSIREIAEQGEFDEFDLNEFFSADGDEFVHEEYVQKWLDLIRGAYTENYVSELKQGKVKPPMPYTDTRFLSYLQHTYWFLPSVASCKAMAKLLAKDRTVFMRHIRLLWQQVMRLEWAPMLYNLFIMQWVIPSIAAQLLYHAANFLRV